MRMEHIVKVYNMGKSSIVENYSSCLKERERLKVKMDSGIYVEEEDIKDMDERCQDALRMLSAYTAVHDVWEDIPIARDDVVVQNNILYCPFGDDAPNRSILMYPTTLDNESDPYYVSGHNGDGTMTIFSTISINLHNAHKMAKNWIVHGKMPGDL